MSIEQLSPQEKKAWLLAGLFPLENIEGTPEQLQAIELLTHLLSVVTENPERVLSLVIVAGVKDKGVFPQVLQLVAGRAPSVFASSLRLEEPFAVSREEIISVSLSKQLEALLEDE